METTEFKDVRFMTAAEKSRVWRQWVRFMKSGFDARHFMKSLYDHLIQHCSFIAHYNRGGFYAVYFEDPSATQRFLDQFDRSKGCLSVEYGYAWWINDEDYRDINNAMVDATTGLLPELRHMLRERETAKARQEFEQAERRLKDILTTK
jgi:hypothetical protein